MATPVAIFGGVEEIVRRSLASGLAGRVELRTSPGSLRGEALVAYAEALEAKAIICSRDDATELRVIDGDVLVLGVTTASYDLLVRFGNQTDHVWNPTPESIAALVAGWAMAQRHRRRKGT